MEFIFDHTVLSIQFRTCVCSVGLGTSPCDAQPLELSVSSLFYRALYCKHDLPVCLIVTCHFWFGVRVRRRGILVSLRQPELALEARMDN